MIYSDLRWAGQTGIGRYVDAVSDGLPLRDLALDGNKTAITAPVKLWRSLRRVAATDPHARFLSMGFMLPIGSTVPRATFIYGLMQRENRLGGNWFKRAYLDVLVRRQVRGCDAVFTISEQSRGQIEDWLGKSDVPVHNVGAGIAEHFHYDGGVSEQIEPGYLLYVGSLRKTKRFDLVLTSLANMPSAARPELVVVTANKAEVDALVSAAGLPAASVRVLSGVDDAELARLYRGAAASILLSESEGFGLPVAESLACGTRVVCSDIAVFAEISDVGLTKVPVGEDAGAGFRVALAEFASAGRLDKSVADGVAATHNWARTIGQVTGVLNELGWLAPVDAVVGD